jgi:hypothetical protein
MALSFKGLAGWKLFSLLKSLYDNLLRGSLNIIGLSIREVVNFISSKTNLVASSLATCNSLNRPVKLLKIQTIITKEN